MTNRGMSTVFIVASLVIVGLIISSLGNPTIGGTSEITAIKLGEKYPVVDTSQDRCYDSDGKIINPDEEDSLFGQDAQHEGNQPRYEIFDDDVVIDVVTGLMWQRDPGEKISFKDAIANASKCKLLDFDDWRLPTIKELYSLIKFDGVTGISEKDSIPYIDTNYFVFHYGDSSKGERHIDSQYWSSTEYTSTTMGGNHTVFGVNFADGRIKGYPSIDPRGAIKLNYVLYVRGNTDYGKNEFVDNGDGTITDSATNLMWTRDDSKKGMNWEEALKWTQKMNDEEYLGYDDWRIPNAKELESIVDYSRSPDATNSAAINPIFNTTKDGDNYPYFWSSTSHLDGPKDMQGNHACYIAFGEARGWMEDPRTHKKMLMDVHGAGAQRSDPKSGDPGKFPYGRGPQGDVIKIYNFVRLVRDAD